MPEADSMVDTIAQLCREGDSLRLVLRRDSEVVDGTFNRVYDGGIVLHIAGTYQSYSNDDIASFSVGAPEGAPASPAPASDTSAAPKSKRKKSKKKKQKPPGDVRTQEVQRANLSDFAQFLLNSCTFEGLSNKHHGTGFFQEKLFGKVERTLKQVKPADHRRRGQVKLTLARMTYTSPRAAGTRSPTKFLREALVQLGSDALRARKRDTARAYLAEALCLCSTVHDTRRPLGLLVASYLTDWVVPISDDMLEPAMAELGDRTEDKRWLQADMSYYLSMSELAREAVGQVWMSNEARMGLLRNIYLEALQSADADPMRGRIGMPSMDSMSGAAELFERVRLTVIELNNEVHFRRDKALCERLIGVLDGAAAYWNARAFCHKQECYQPLVDRCREFSEDVVEQPTKLAVEELLPVADDVRRMLERDYEERMVRATPRLTLSDVLQDDAYTPDSEGRVTLALNVASHSSSAAITKLRLHLVEQPGVIGAQGKGAFFAGRLQGGRSQELELPVLVKDPPTERTSLSLQVRASYEVPGHPDRPKQQELFPVNVTLELAGPDDHLIEDNRYLTYASGVPVKEPGMFFGRQKLLDDLKVQMTSSSGGAWCVLYGVPRCGKSSVIFQLKRQLTKQKHVCVQFGLQRGLAYDSPGEFNAWFGREAGLHLSYAIKPLGLPDDLWQRLRELDRVVDPMQGLTTALRDLREILDGREGQPQIVLLVDEFGSLWDSKNARRVEVFIKTWKALLEDMLFNAISIGHNSMMDFKDSFPVEFNRADVRNLGYLSRGASYKLMETPIPYRDASRYRGRAREVLYDVTAGHPLFLQKLCSQVVEEINDGSSPYVTSTVVERAAQKLISNRQKPLEFGHLVKELKDELDDERSFQDAQELLSALAKSAGTRGARRRHLPRVNKQSMLLEKLLSYHVLEQSEEGLYRIRLKLYADWLRRRRQVTEQGDDDS